MARPRRFALALLCAAAAIGGFEWSGIESPVTPIWNRAVAGGASVDAGPVGALLARAIASMGAASHRELGEAAEASAAVPAADAADPDPRETTFGLASVSATEAPEKRGPLVSLFRPEPVEEEAQPTARAVEPLDECLVIDICIDEYLWSLYERTPKVDTNKVTEQIKTTVKTKKGKTKTVTKTITNYVVADFGWKDPIAAQKVGMSLKDYVIGGMDRGFKLKLFRALRMMDDAGYMPGITSAFRDDYRQSIASGNKAASDSSFHGGSRRGGYGHGLAIDLVSVKGATRLQRFAASEELWKWVDAHETELGVGRPYLDRDPPHIGAIDGKEYAAKRGGRPATARKVANGAGASGAKSTASTQPPAPKIAKNEGASGAKSAASTQPPAPKIAKNEGASGAKSAASTQPTERKKAKRATPAASKAAGMVVHSSLQ
jgi:hypothetical protein